MAATRRVPKETIGINGVIHDRECPRFKDYEKRFTILDGNGPSNYMLALEDLNQEEIYSIVREVCKGRDITSD